MSVVVQRTNARPRFDHVLALGRVAEIASDAGEQIDDLRFVGGRRLRRA